MRQAGVLDWDIRTALGYSVVFVKTETAWLGGTAVLVATFAACSVYNDTVVGGGGTTGSSFTASSGGTSSSSSSSSSGGDGGAPCAGPSDCSAGTSECQTPVCKDGLCGLEYAPAGTPVTSQKAGDCKVVVCDGYGDTTSVGEDTDEPNDGNECTSESCAGGEPKYTPLPSTTSCTQDGGKRCDGSGKCVECLSASDCTSGVCGVTNQCAAPSCDDGKKNGAETDVDCGGGCPGCGLNKSCAGDADCISSTCTASVCAASCTDGIADGQETDVDCGGACPNKCASGKGCGGAGDCQSGKCSGGVCADVLVLSQLQTRGTNGGNDEFVEIHNPTGIAVTFDADWSVAARSAVSVNTTTCKNNGLGTRYSGVGQVIPSHGHLLLANDGTSGYNGSTTADAFYSTGITDAASVVLLYKSVAVDAVCFHFDATTMSVLQGCQEAPYICEGAPVLNPHNNTTSTNDDSSLERKPGGALGNATDTGDNANDFQVLTPSAARNLASLPAQ